MTAKTASQAEFREKFIAYVDVLGFKNLVKSAESGTGMTLPALLDMLKRLGTQESRDQYVKYGPRICPHAKSIQRDLDFCVTQVSDCVVVSAEVSPGGVINLVGHCWAAVLELLVNGIMCRGYITRGSIYHVDAQVIGSGYVRAYLKEGDVSAFRREADDRGTPFVEIDPAVCDYVRECGDSCVGECCRGSLSRMAPSSRYSRSREFRTSSCSLRGKNSSRTRRNMRFRRYERCWRMSKAGLRSL